MLDVAHLGLELMDRKAKIWLKKEKPLQMGLNEAKLNGLHALMAAMNGFF